MTNVLFVLLVILLVASPSDATLSKSKAPKTKNEKKSTKTNDKSESSMVTHTQFDTSEGKRSFIKLGYVTPWNGHGYDVAKWTAQKYTHISPVWFQVVLARIDGYLSCELKGQHDIDRDWLRDLRKNNSNIKIVPRFLFEATDPELLKQFIFAEAAQLRCANVLTAFLERNQFDGCVFEFLVQILMKINETLTDYLMEMTEVFSKRLRLKNMLFIVPIVPLIRQAKPDGRAYLPIEVVIKLLDFVDYLNVMTYDFSGTDGEGNAPIEWVQNNVELFLRIDSEYNSKLLIGINYYGHCKGEIKDAIIGDKFISLLKDKSFELFWNEISHENYIKSHSTVCFFPTLHSINERLSLVAEKRLGGVAIWELGQGLNHFTSLL